MTWIPLSLCYPTELIKTIQPEELASSVSNETSSDDDDEFSWYKPVAVILKPATQRDFQKLLKDDRILDELIRPPHYYKSPNYYHHQPDPAPQRPSYWPSSAVQDSWEFENPQGFPPYSQGRHYERQQPDRLRDVYDRFDLPDHVQGNLLSLARMGLVAIPTKEIGSRKNDADNERGTRILLLLFFNNMHNFVIPPCNFRCPVKKRTSA
jgi:hypothetical protein